MLLIFAEMLMLRPPHVTNASVLLYKSGQMKVTYFSPLGKLAERAIYFTFGNFLLFSSLMISRRQIILGSAGPIFAIFSPNESILGVDF